MKYIFIINSNFWYLKPSPILLILLALLKTKKFKKYFKLKLKYVDDDSDKKRRVCNLNGCHYVHSGCSRWGGACLPSYLLKRYDWNTKLWIKTKLIFCLFFKNNMIESYVIIIN